MGLPDIATDKLRPDERIYTAGEAVILFTPVEPYALNEPFLTEAEKNYISLHKNTARRNEGAAWRSILRRVTGCGETAYTPSGAPYIPESKLHIGVSHTDCFAAVILSKHRCSIDIEPESRNFLRAAERYMSATEAGLGNGYGTLWPTIVWCAKETLYKFADTPQLNMLRDIRITASDASRATVFGMVINAAGEPENYILHTFTHADTLCTWMTHSPFRR